MSPICGAPAYLRTDPSDPGKSRYCERPAGHDGRHMTHYCGRRRYWAAMSETKYTLTNEEAYILAHTANTGRYVGKGHALMALAKRGLFYDHGPQKLAGGAHYLVISTEGREALSEWRASQPKPPKKKRPSKQFQAWLNYREANGRLSFPEFLKRLKEGQYDHYAV